MMDVKNIINAIHPFFRFFRRIKYIQKQVAVETIRVITPPPINGFILNMPQTVMF